LVNRGAKDVGTLADVSALIKRGAMALPSFTDLGGPVPGSANKGRLVGEVGPHERHALASLYCALMTDQSLTAIQSAGDVIVDGPFSQNAVYLALIAALRSGRFGSSGQRVLTSQLRDGTTAGAACLGLMNSAMPPKVAIAMNVAKPEVIDGFEDYVAKWRAHIA
jgi:sugar (pentulose or hexulose) kinase